MFWVGESVTLLDACALVVTVRVEEPAVAVIVTEVALALCQLRVTLCPVSIEVGLTARVTVGLDGGGGGVFALPAQPLRQAKTADTSPKPRQREGALLIVNVCQFKCPCSATFSDANWRNSVDGKLGRKPRGQGPLACRCPAGPLQGEVAVNVDPVPRFQQHWWAQSREPPRAACTHGFLRRLSLGGPLLHKLLISKGDKDIIGGFTMRRCGSHTFLPLRWLNVMLVRALPRLGCSPVIWALRRNQSVLAV